MDDDYKKIIKETAREMQEKMDKYGWRVDALIDPNCETGTGVDIHTHGLEENFGHKDLQCALPVKCLVDEGDETLFSNIICDIFRKIMAKIKEGQEFKAGKCYGGILGNDTKIRFLASSDKNGRDMLRVIIPDENGKLHKSLIEDSFKPQFNGI